MIYFKTKENTEVAFDPCWIKYSIYLSLLKDKGFLLDPKKKNDDVHLNLERFCESTMKEMIDFLHQYHDMPFNPPMPPLRDYHVDARLPFWCQVFLRSLPTTSVLSLLKLADYLDVKVLTDTLCATVATEILQKTSGEIGDMF